MITAAILAVILPQTPEPKAKTLYDFSFQTIEDKAFAPKSVKGKVVLIVNTASRCGLTPQYKGLQALYEQHKDKGLVVMGFPANNFNNQEPGTNSEILEFCQTQYGVTFPMMAKISVKGEDIHPLFKWLVESTDRPQEPVEWNFAKFLVDRSGNVRFRFSPRERPESEFIQARINELLAEK